MNSFHRPHTNFSLDAQGGRANNALTMTQESAPQTLEASDGTRLAYRVRQAGPVAPVIALVHSLGMDHRFWDPVALSLGGRATLVTIDARGHGRSGLGQAPVTAQRMADDLAEVLDHLGVSSAIVGGASMGGCIALQFADGISAVDPKRYPQSCQFCDQQPFCRIRERLGEPVTEGEGGE